MLGMNWVVIKGKFFIWVNYFSSKAIIRIDDILCQHFFSAETGLLGNKLSSEPREEAACLILIQSLKTFTQEN